MVSRSDSLTTPLAVGVVWYFVLYYFPDMFPRKEDVFVSRLNFTQTISAAYPNLNKVQQAALQCGPAATTDSQLRHRPVQHAARHRKQRLEACQGVQVAPQRVD